MSNPNSVVIEILRTFPQWRPQMYFKSSLTALSHAMEDQVLAGEDEPLIIATFQKERFYRQEAHRYQKIARLSSHVYVLAAPETEFSNSSDSYEKIAFNDDDSLAQEWHLVVIARNYSNCLICREKLVAPSENESKATIDNNRRFEGIWTCERAVSQKAAEFLLHRIKEYRPEIEDKVNSSLQTYCYASPSRRTKLWLKSNLQTNPDPFVQRLIAYLQAGQYKLMKANRFLMEKEKKERLLNSVSNAIRRSLNSEEILQVAVDKLGEGLGVCRCLIYRCQKNDLNAEIQHEFLNQNINSLKGKAWPLKNNPLFQEILNLRESISIDDVTIDPRFQDKSNILSKLINSCSIVSWLIVPIFYQGKLLGMMELHHCNSNAITWKNEDIALVDAIATQVGVALIQAESYTHLEELNEQLEALDRTRSNLVAITGHELRTPLSTIQICLESLANEPDMSAELRQVMLSTALHDAERMRKLIQDFLTLSQLESGTVDWNPEPLSLSECIELSLSHIRAHAMRNSLPRIETKIQNSIPLVQADGEWLVEVLSKLIDNACKFTNSNGKITINVQTKDEKTLEVTVADNGRGIEPDRLEKVFDRFYQEEGALRRSAGGDRIRISDLPSNGAKLGRTNLGRISREKSR